MKRRVLTRGEQGSGRADDNAEALVQRFQDFRAASMPVIELLEGKGMLSRISSEAAPDEVYRELAVLLREAGLAQSTSTLANTVRTSTSCFTFVCLSAVSCVRSRDRHVVVHVHAGLLGMLLRGAVRETRHRKRPKGFRTQPTDGF